MSKKDIDWAALYAQAKAERITETTEQILADPDAYECHACAIEGQPCDVGLAVKVERERIIKLLAENFSRFDASNNQVDYMSLSDFIAVIEGGNK